MMNKNIRVLILCSILAALFILSCSEKDRPPFIKAKITDAAGNITVVNNFRLLYWWEERNETPYLKPHTLYTKELTVVIMSPINNNPKRVKISTEILPIPELKSIEIISETTGYQLSIESKSGKKISATDEFPRILKKDNDSGIADNLLYGYGKVRRNNKEEEFKKSFNILKKIDILEVKTVND